MRAVRGNQHGWTKIREAQTFAYWQALVQEVAFERDARPDRFRRALSVSSFADCLVALHVGATDAAEAIMKRLIGESRDGEPNYWRVSTSALPFQARLYELLTEKPLPIDWSKLLPLGDYEPLLSDACVGAAYTDGLDWACREHIEQTRLNNKKFWPFAIGLSTAMPIEIMSWLRYRRARGLEHATLGHPLLESPLASLDPAPSSPPASELLRLFELGIPHMRAYLQA